MSQQDADPSESATPYKLEQARKKGSVAKSADLTASIILIALVLCMYAVGWGGVKKMIGLQYQILALVGKRGWGAEQILSVVSHLLIAMLEILAPLMLSVALSAILITLLQVGPVLSFQPLSPDLEKLNPITGAKRFFSMRIIYESGKGLIKLCVLASVAYISILDQIPFFLTLPQWAPKDYLQLLMSMLSSLCAKLAMVLFMLAIIDVAYSRWEFAKKMRMSRRDIKDESKNREGDPRIRSRMRELRNEMLKRSKATRNVSTADVLITNPTHIAVALSYDVDGGAAPRLVAKGAGELAAKMREIATRHNIPIVQNRALARTLYREVGFDSFVPETLYGQLAKILVWVHVKRTQRAL